MEGLHPRGHGTGYSFDAPRAREEAALQAEDDLAGGPVDVGDDDEQAVRVARGLVTRAVAAPDRDGRRSFVDDLEVVGYLGAAVVRRRRELRALP